MQLYGNFAYLIQKQRSLVRQFKTPHSLIGRPGKCPFFMTKQIAFQQPGRHDCAVHFHHALIASFAEVVDGTGYQLFTGAGFAEDQHRTVAFRYHFHLFEHGGHYHAAADNLAEVRVIAVNLLGQIQVLMHQALFEPVNFLIGQRVIHRNRDTLGDLLQHPQVGSVEVVRLTLRQLEYAQGFVAEN
ncbi:hypothetical protein D3C80_649580 [compost metagenome]